MLAKFLPGNYEKVFLNLSFSLDSSSTSDEDDNSEVPSQPNVTEENIGRYFCVYYESKRYWGSLLKVRIVRFH